MSEAIGRDEFTARLAALCIGGSAGLPQRVRDWRFADGIAGIDPVDVISLALDERAARKSAHDREAD